MCRRTTENVERLNGNMHALRYGKEGWVERGTCRKAIFCSNLLTGRCGMAWEIFIQHNVCDALSDVEDSTTSTE